MMDATPRTEAMTPPRPWMRLAGMASLASAAVAAVALILLFAMFGAFGAGATAAGRTFGSINDALIIVAYLLAVPGVLASAALLRSTRGGLTAIVALAALVALGSIVAIAVLQWQLVTGTLTFEEQIGPASVAFLALGSWFIISGFLGAGILPYGVGIGALAAVYIGYPLLAYRLGRSLVASTGGREPIVERGGA